MKAIVVDTNVLIVANKASEQAGPDHVTACVNALEKAHSRQIVVIDSDNRIFDEYFRYANHSGQPGMGDVFARWLFDNQGHPERCERVVITSKRDDPDNFEEFPNDDPKLAGFDRSDRKFVAVAIVSSHRPKVLNASDSDWWHFRAPLKSHGVVVEFLCPDLMPSGS
jgi:hypothetical protein